MKSKAFDRKSMIFIGRFEQADIAGKDRHKGF